MIYLGNFFHLTNQEEKSDIDRRHGEFCLIVQADSSDSAIRMFRDRIVEARETSDLFEGSSRIYFTQLLEFDVFPSSHAVLINFKSVAGDPKMPFIGCTVPEKDQEVCRIFDWNARRPSIDGRKEDLFLEFSP